MSSIDFSNYCSCYALNKTTIYSEILGRSMKRIPELHLQIYFFRSISGESVCFGVILRSQTWISGRRKQQKSSSCEVLAAENPGICLHHVTNFQKACDTEKRIFLNLHISDNTRHSLLTGKKKPSGLFSRHGVRRGIPICPFELENTLALNST